MKIKNNTLLIELQEAEHSTSTGIIVDQSDDKFVSHGKLVQDAYVKLYEQECYEVIPAGSHILYSKDKHVPVSEKEAVVEYKYVIAWEEVNG